MHPADRSDALATPESLPAGRIHLEHEVKTYVLNLLRTEDIFDKVATHQQAEYTTELQGEIERLRKAVDAHPERKRKLFDLYEKGDITRVEFIERNEEHNQAETQYRELLTQKDPQPSHVAEDRPRTVSKDLGISGEELGAL